MDTLKLLKTLCETPGPPGREDAVREVVREQWAPLTDSQRVDAMGNLIALRHGTGPAPRQTLMIAVHMDEIGLIVTGQDGEFLRVHTLGGNDRRVLLGQEVTVHGRQDVPGIIGNRPPHVLSASERDKVPSWRGLFIDTGLAEDELRGLVRTGDHVTLRCPLVELRNRRVAAKALDNRASVAAATLALEMLQQRAHAWDVAAVATVQEEMGVKGAITSAYGVAPQMAIALDVTFAKQYDDSGPGAFSLDKGPTIGVGPNLHPQIVERLNEIAKREEIPVETEPLPGSSGTDAWGIQVAREGIPCGLISIPIRYMHQPVELVALRDIERAARLLVSFICELEADFELSWEDEA